MLILIDNYDSFTYNLVHYLGELGATCQVFRNDKISVGEVLKMAPKGIVLSPGPCTPNEAGICLELIAKAGPTIPLLGVCLGHQAIGQAYGGKVIRAPVVMHGKLSKISNKGQGVFKGLPKRFEVTRYHSLIVERPSLPVRQAEPEVEDSPLPDRQRLEDGADLIPHPPKERGSGRGYRPPVLDELSEASLLFLPDGGLEGQGGPEHGVDLFDLPR